MTKSAKRILYISIIVIVIGALAYPKLPEGKEPAPAENEPTTENALTVNAVKLTSETLNNQVKITGTVMADESVALNAEVAGKVEAIYFEEGQKIKEGALLLRLNDEEILAELEKFQFTKKLNEDNEYRQKQLLEKEAISMEEYETALTTLNTTKAEIKVLQARLEKHRITAPFDGLIGLRNVSEGSYLNPGSAIAQLYRVHPVKVEFSIPGRYLQLVNVGDEISFAVDAYNETFSGRIYAIEPQIDPQTRSIRIRARAGNEDSKLLPGQFARINLTLETIENALMVPSQAIIPELNGKKVFVYKEGVATSVPIETGIRTENEVQVTSGLDVGDIVITSGILQIKDGVNVNVNLN